MSGNVIARPAIAYGPTPCPIKMLSHILYKEDAVIAMMAGMAYCLSNLEIFSVPSSVGITAGIKLYGWLKKFYYFCVPDRDAVQK
jgi:hypothetical protein